MSSEEIPETAVSIPGPGHVMIHLDQWDRGVIVGLVLGGSGQIIRYKTHGNIFLYSFYVAKTLNGFESRKSLMTYVHSIFYPLRWKSKGSNIHDIQPGKPSRGVHPKTEYAMELKPLHVFKFFGQQFFDYDSNENGLKTRVMPELITRWLTPLSLCVMFIDSGGCKKGDLPYLNLTHYQRLSDRLDLQDALKYNFNIDTIEETTHGTNNIRLYIQESDAQKFFDIIEPFSTPLDCIEFIQHAKKNWEWSLKSKD